MEIFNDEELEEEWSFVMQAKRRLFFPEMFLVNEEVSRYFLSE